MLKKIIKNVKSYLKKIRKFFHMDSMRTLFDRIVELNIESNTTIEKGLCKLFEESGEFAQSVNKMIGVKRHKQSKEEIREEIAEEAADTIQNIFSTADKCGVSYEEILEALKKKNKKWEDKINKKNQEE